MSLTNILILILTALIIRIAFPGKTRKWALLIVSVVAIYWMQPILPIRNMDFWFPSATLGLIAFSWALTAEKEQLREKENGIAAGLVLLTLTFIALTRLISLEGLLTASRPPQLYQVAIAILIIGVISFSLIRFVKKSRLTLIFGIIIIFFLFIFLKNPVLAKLASGGLRQAMAQNPTLAKSTDLGWLGFSYVAFRLIHTLIDRINNRLKDIRLGEYFVFILFFPAFTAGPLDRLQRFRKDLESPKPLSSTEILQGGVRLATGLFRKFILADSLALIAISVTNVSQVKSTLWLWVMLFAYAFQIFFDFAGYTDIAIGMGILLGFNLPENFNQPYRQPNLTLFWNNWHMSLTQWFRGYFFNPITRGLRKRSKLSIPWIILITQLSTFIVIGLWHGITLNFIVWGAWHGLGIFIHNRWSSFAAPKLANLTETRPFIGQISKVGGIVGTFIFVSLGWVWFALPNMSLALDTFAKLFGKG